MSTKSFSIISFTVACLIVRHAGGAITSAWPDDPGWTYQFDCDTLTNNCGLPSSTFDGTWRTGGGSDTWDGSAPGGVIDNVCNHPGGYGQFTEDGVSYVRMQDTGSPAANGFTGATNRKLMVGRMLDANDSASATYLADGFTFSFRARIPTPSTTTNGLDPLYPSAGGGPVAYPTNGDGYVTFDGGKGNFTLHDGEPPPGGFNEVNGTVRGASIAFSLTQKGDTIPGTVTNNAFAGLTMNELAGSAANNNVNFGQGSGTNLVACDPTQWEEFWIVIKADPSGIGTHLAYIFRNGALKPSVIHLTAGGSSGAADYGGGASYITVSSPATAQSCALDVDFIRYKLAEAYPSGAILPPAVLAARPAVGQPFYPTSSNLVVRVDAFGTNTISTSGAQLVLNGVDVSAGLAATGPAQDRTFTYSSLVVNKIYTGRIIVTDSGGNSVTNAFSFDTFDESSTTIVEAEEYNYNGGSFINNPAPNAYNGNTGTYNIDYVDSSLQSAALAYRGDAVDVNVCLDFARPRFISSGQTDNQIGGIVRGEWVNYTRTFSAGSYKIYLRAAAITAQDVRLDLVTGNTAAPNQPVKYLGTFHVPDTGAILTYTDAPLSDMGGNELAVALASGNNTLRLTAVTDVNENAADEDANNNMSWNYLVLVSTATPAAPVVATTPAASENGDRPDKAIEAAIYDGSNPVDLNSVVLTVNGSTVSPTKSKSGSVTSVKYTPSPLWPVLSSNYVTLAFNDGSARSVSWSFTVEYLPTLSPAMKVSDAATSGFVFQSYANPDNQAALVLRAKLAMAGQLTNSSGQLLTNLADNTFTGPADANGTPDPPTYGPYTFHIPTVINMSDGGPYGNFGPDDPFPGFQGVDSVGLNAAATALVQLPAGVNTMVIDSQDGFEVQAGFLNDAPLVLLHLDGQLGTGNQHPTSFIVQEAGVYPFRVFWFHVQHQYALEWAVINPDGRYGLVNDTANADQPGPASFSTGTIPAAPHPTLTITPAGSGNVTITWGSVGTLQVANAVAGPYSDVLGATSPFTTAATGTKFYRVRVP